MKRLEFHVFVVFLAVGTMVLANCATMEAKMAKNEVTTWEGGRSTYVSYEGSATIVRVGKTPASGAQSKVIGGAGYEGYEVWFRFVPKSDVLPVQAKSLMSREHLLTLHNGWYVGPRYLRKYGIEVGKTYPCVLKLLEEGVSTPVVFEFERIDSKDYFESRQ